MIKILFFLKGLAEKLGFSVFLVFFSCSFAQARIPVMVGLGDSIGEGVQSADASYRTQPNSYINLIAGQIGIRFSSPLIKSGPGAMVGDTSRRFRLFSFIASPNLAVSGADVNSLINDRADAIQVEEINSETDLVLFPRTGSQIEIVESMTPFMIVGWIGNNDVLSAVISFDQLDASQITSVSEFQAGFIEIAERLSDAGEIVVLANIPDVSSISFLVNRQDLIKFLGSDFGLKEGDYTSIAAMFLIKLGLADQSLIQDPDFVLDAAEIQIIQERIETFNQIIEDVADSNGIPIVDINGLFNEITVNPPIFVDIPITPRFLGGFFSLDGVHPSNIAHAVIANAFIETINSNFKINIPCISTEELTDIFLKDPFIDKDGDGRVRGRPGAGLLETLAPFLGISGDRNDSINEGFLLRADSCPRQQFIDKFLIFGKENFQMDSQWNKKDAINAFKFIFRLKIPGGDQGW